MISATWWTNSTIYIPEYSQYWFQHAALNLITTRREFTLLQYSTTLSCIIASFCIIFDICNMINYRFIYIPEYSQFWFHHAPLNLITTRREFTLLQYSTTFSSLITSFCIIFYICNMINYRFIYIPEYSQYWFQHAVLNLISTRREFTLSQYSTTLSSLITSFCIIFDICNMMNQQYYIYSRILPVLISTCCIEFNHYKTWIHSITVFYNTLMHNRIILYHIWYLQHDKLSFYIYSRILPVLISSCSIEFNHYKTWIHSITVFYNILKLNHIILYHIWYLQHDKLPFYIYSRILPVLISTCFIEFNLYKTWIYSITVFYNTLKLNHIILYHIWYLQHDEPTVLYIFQNTPSIDFNMLHWI